MWRVTTAYFEHGSRQNDARDCDQQEASRERAGEQIEGIQWKPQLEGESSGAINRRKGRLACGYVRSPGYQVIETASGRAIKESLERVIGNVQNNPEPGKPTHRQDGSSNSREKATNASASSTLSVCLAELVLGIDVDRGWWANGSHRQLWDEKNSPSQGQANRSSSQATGSTTAESIDSATAHG